MPDQPTTHREFGEAMKAGDDRLRDHIDQSVRELATAQAHADHQVSTALTAADKLEIERIRRVSELAATELEQLKVRVSEADDRLTVHIGEQIGQIRAALEAVQRETGIAHEAARELEVTRVSAIQRTMDVAIKALEDRVDDKVGSAAREVQIAFDAAQQAIAKAEEANKQRFAAHNAFREEAAERWRTTMPREVAETMINALAAKLADIEAQTNARVRELELGRANTTGSTDQQRRRADSGERWQIWAAGIGVTVVLTLIIFLANVLTSPAAAVLA